MIAQPLGSKTPGSGGFVFQGGRWAPYAFPAVVLLALAWLYRVVLGFDYVWDDGVFFVTSAQMRNGDFLAVITAPVLAGTSYFRPLVMASFVTELRLGGADPMWSHLTNLILHLANTLMVGALAIKLRRGLDLGRQRAPFVAALAMLAYGFHPALTEGVAWISGRFDLGVTFFSLLALLLLANGSVVACIAAGLAFLAAAGCKEMAAALPAIAFLFLWALRRPDASLSQALRAALGGRELLAYGLLVAAGVVYLGVRGHYLGAHLNSDPLLQQMLASPLRRVGFIGATLAFYGKVMVWPFMDLGPLHPFNVSAMTLAEEVAGAAFVVLCLVFVAYSLWRPTRARLLATAAIVSLLPVVNIIPLMIVGNIGHERFLVLPLALAVLALVSVDPSGWKMSAILRSRLPLLGGVLLAAWAALAMLNVHMTLPLWRNDVALFSWAHAKHPSDLFAQFSLAGAALKAKQNDLAGSVLKEAEKRGPLPLKLSIPYAQYLIRTGDPHGGIEKLGKALSAEVQPHVALESNGVQLEDAQLNRQEFGAWTLVYAYITLAEGQNATRQFKDAQRSAEIAAFYRRDNPVAQLYRAFAIYGQDRWIEGEAAYAQARSMYSPRVAVEADIVRESFLRQLCAKPEATPVACRKVGELFPQENTAR
jgi:hypothetical protein